MHEQLWPRQPMPTLLTPAAQSRDRLRAARAAQDGFQEIFFAEATMPTSLFMSALCSQAFGSGKRPLLHRRAALQVLKALFSQAAATQQLEFVLLPPRSHVACSFSVKFGSTLPAHLLVSETNWEVVRDLWLKDAQAGQ